MSVKIFNVEFETWELKIIIGVIITFAIILIGIFCSNKIINEYEQKCENNYIFNGIYACNENTEKCYTDEYIRCIEIDSTTGKQNGYRWIKK